MTIYRLNSVETTQNHPRWQASALRGPIWLKAASEEAARTMLERASFKPTAPKTGHPPLLSPWIDARVAECRPDVPHFRVPDGEIVGPRGERLAEISGAA